jgi:hypothetical protein
MALSLVSVPAWASATVNAIGIANKRFIAVLDERIGMIVGKTALQFRRAMTVRVSLPGLLIAIA